jgi:tRNA threonylcarbamoyladenosine modification (KEOPS) complex Cgi121 subunit
MKTHSPSPWFPCWRIKFDSPIESAKEIALHLDEVSSDQSWCLVGARSVGSDRQLWAAWSATRKKEQSNIMLSRSVEMELILHLAGTQSIDLALKRAGICEGDNQAWLLHLPAINPEGLPALDWRELEHEANRLARSIISEIAPRRPSLEMVDCNQLGIEKLSFDELDLLAHISLV